VPGALLESLCEDDHYEYRVFRTLRT
jgi:hypothetical protein